jgi:hypothetical protein
LRFAQGASVAQGSTTKNSMISVVKNSVPCSWRDPHAGLIELLGQGRERHHSTTKHESSTCIRDTTGGQCTNRLLMCCCVELFHMSLHHCCCSGMLALPQSRHWQHCSVREQHLRLVQKVVNQRQQQQHQTVAKMMLANMAWN